MTTSWYPDSEFICYVTMESAINETHNVTIYREGNLYMKIGGSPAGSQTFTFTPANWATPQEMILYANENGGYDLRCEITSSYYISHGTLKVKEDTIHITIDSAPPDEFIGDAAGVMVGGGGEANCLDCQLRAYHQSEGAGETISVTASGAFAAIVVRPNGSTLFKTLSGAAVIDTCNQIGRYEIQIYRSHYVGAGISLGETDFDYYVGAALFSSVTAHNRGGAYEFSTEYGTDYDETYNTQYGQPNDVFKPYGAFTVFEAEGTPPICASDIGATFSAESGGNISFKWQINPPTFGNTITVIVETEFGNFHLVIQRDS